MSPLQASFCEDWAGLCPCSKEHGVMRAWPAPKPSSSARGSPWIKPGLLQKIGMEAERGAACGMLLRGSLKKGMSPSPLPLKALGGK